MSERSVTMRGNRVSLVGEELRIGDKAPDFRLLDHCLNTKVLYDFGEKIKLISAVPSLDTGVCDEQTRRFNEAVAHIPEAIVITVSVDLPFNQSRWCGSSGFDQAITLSDHRDVSFGKAYGVLIEELRLLCRAVFVLNKSNEIVYVQYVKEVSDHPDYDLALDAVRSSL